MYTFSSSQKAGVVEVTKSVWLIVVFHKSLLRSNNSILLTILMNKIQNFINLPVKSF